MHRCLENAGEPGSESELRQFVQHSNVEELVQIVRNNICKPDATKVLDDLLQAFPDSDACQLKRRKLTESSLKILDKAKISVGQANAIVNRIISHLPRYSKQHLIKLVEFSLETIRLDDNELHSWKDLLPVLLETLENEKHVVHIDTEISGTEYKSLIIQSVCDCRWNIHLLPSLAKMFGDMSLSKADRNKVLKTLCSSLPDLRLDHVPSFVYHASKLCKDRDNQKLLDALSKYFDGCYSKILSAERREDSFESIGILNMKEVQDIESTVLYHVYQAAQLNHESMKDFIRFLKQVSYAPEYTLQPFMLAVLMSVSNIYEDQVFEVLRMAIVNNSLEKEKRQSSGWLRQLLPSSRDIPEIIHRVIDSSNKDRHLVLRGLTSLAFMLMCADHKLKNNATAMWRIGSEIVQGIIKKCHETVPIVLQELINKIIAGGTSTTHYTDCLKYTCRELSVIVLDHQAWIMTLLERLLFLPSTVASRVLHAILPLMRVSPNIRENLLLTLRKALYRKGTTKRQLAVTGFLEMLKYSKLHSLSNFRLSQRCNSSGHTITSSSLSTLTQVTLECNSQREKTFIGCDKSLCFEILDILRKSFTYEFHIRLYMYEGLYDTVTKNSEITEPILDMLLSHFDLYFNTDVTILPPVKFQLCTDTRGVDVIMKEPLGQLIFLLQKICVDADGKNSITLDKLRNTLESLCTRMIITDLEHLNLEHGIDFTQEDFSKSQVKMKNLHIAITICEALIAFEIGRWSKGHEESVHKIDDLFKAYTRLIDFIKMQSAKVKKSTDAGKANKKDRDASNTTRKLARSNNNVKLPDTIMDFDAIRQSLLLLYSQSPSTRNRSALRENLNFSLYILQTCRQLLQRTKSFTDDISQVKNKKHLNAYIEIGGLLYRYFLLHLNDALANDKQVTILALQCFKEISSCICTLIPSELSRLLHSILRAGRNSTSVDTNCQLQEIIFSIEPYLRASLVDDVDGNEKESMLPFLLLQIIEQFAAQINLENYNHDKMLECIREMIRLEDVQSPVVPAMVRFFLNMEERMQRYGETLNEICLELCEKAGCIDGGELVTAGRYKIIRDDTVLQLYSVLNGQIKEKLNDASWLLMRLKAEHTIARSFGTIDQAWNDSLREKERNLCKQLSRVAQVLLTLANTTVKPGPCTDVTFKNLQFLYHLLANLTKYFYVKSNDQTAAFQAVKFIQVVQLAGNPLKTAFYNLVTYVEENQNRLHSKSDSQAQRNKILKETKVIPRVVYEIEQFNKEVLLLGKRTGVPLENYMKHSVTRDFRIKNPELVEGLEKMDASMLVSTNVEANENGTEHEHEHELELEHGHGHEKESEDEDKDDCENESRNTNVGETGSNSDYSIPSRKRSRTDD